VTASYESVLAPALATPAQWTGSESRCEAGSSSLSSQRATLAAVNYMRSLAGLDPVRQSLALSSKAQSAALVYAANDSVTHDIPRSWKCYTNSAKEAGANSNIAWGSNNALAGAKGILGYMDDEGDYNTVVGHRRWILSPNLNTVGIGSTDTTNVLWVTDQTARARTNPKWVTWPTKGYFPQQLEPSGRWSISGKAGKAYDFRSAKVTVTRGGSKLHVTTHPSEDGYGSDTLVFEVDGVRPPTGAAVDKYTVSLRGVKVAGASRPISYSYTVSLFDPTA
jgi:uncharacterized protein YkwD